MHVYIYIYMCIHTHKIGIHRYSLRDVVLMTSGVLSGDMPGRWSQPHCRGQGWHVAQASRGGARAAGSAQILQDQNDQNDQND